MAWVLNWVTAEFCTAHPELSSHSALDRASEQAENPCNCISVAQLCALCHTPFTMTGSFPPLMYLLNVFQFFCPFSALPYTLYTEVKRNFFGNHMHLWNIKTHSSISKYNFWLRFFEMQKKIYPGPRTFVVWIVLGPEVCSVLGRS